MTITSLLAILAMSSAAPPMESYEFEVSVPRDATAEDAIRIYRDIRRQAAIRCRPLNKSPRFNPPAEKACRRDMIDTAIRQIDVPVLTDFHGHFSAGK